MYKKISISIVSACIAFGGMFVASVAPSGAAANPANPAKSIVYPCHNDTHMVNNFTGHGSKFPNDHRDNPNVGLTGASHPASVIHADGGYYYLDITACSSTIHVLVTEGCWLYMFGSGTDRMSGNVIYQTLTMSTIDLTYTHAIVGQTYFMRLQNTDANTQTDTSSIDSPPGG